MSPPGGGSRGVGGGSPPSTTQEIIDNLFGGGKETKVAADQQAQQLRDQSRQQQEMRDTSSPSHTHESEGQTGEARGRDTQPARARMADAPAKAKETELDSFLARASTQQTQREAGKEMTRPQTMASVSAQAWSVANSPQTPDLARGLIQARQQQMQGNPQQAQANPQAGGRSQPMPQQSAFIPRSVTPMMPNAQPEVPPVLIRYAMTSSGGETAARPFTQNPMLSDQFGRQVQRMIQEQMGRSAQQSLGNEAQVAVQVRGNIIFVKDGNKTRAFKLGKDGDLHELPSEDASEHPLSPEAQKLLNKVMRQKGLHARMEGGSAEHLKDVGDKELEEAKGKKLESNGESGEGLDFETRFALLLHEVLEDGKMLGKELEGDPMFPEKGDWEAFFARMAKMGNQPQVKKKSMDSILNLIFRGVFKKQGEGGGNVLVGDLLYQMQGKSKEGKFAQLAFSDAKLLAFLQSLKPGQKISKELLQQYFGEELSFTELAHLTEKLYNMATSAEKNVIFNPKSQVDLYSQARLEKNLLSTRKDPKPMPKTAGGAGSEESSGATIAPNGFSAHVLEKLGMRERYKGKPRLYTLIVYGTLATVVTLTLLFLLLKYA